MDFLTLKNEVVSVLDNGIVFAKDNGFEDAIEYIEKSRERLKKNEIVVLVCGEIKRGKSSLLSAFLEEKDLFPINVNVATNTVTIIKYGETERIEVVFENGDSYESKLVQRNEISSYVTEQGNKNNEKKVKYVYIQTPNPKLKNGLVFVDTPGVGSLNIEHSEITYGYLPNADVVLFVSDVLNPLTGLELKFLRSASEHCDNILFPLTKIDLSENAEKIKNENFSKIAEFTSIPKDEIQIIPVSNLAKLRYIDSKQIKYIKSSNYQELERIIWTTVNNKRAKILFVPPLMKLATQLSKIESSLKIEFESLKQDSKAAKEIELELKKSSEERQRLLEDSSEWRSQLDYELNKIFNDALDYVLNSQKTISVDLRETLKNPSVVNNLKDLTLSINDLLYNLVTNVKDDISEALSDIIDKTENKLGLNLKVDGSSVDLIKIEDTDINFDINEKGRFDKAITVGRNMAMNGSGAAAVIGFAGGVIGGLIGIFGGPIGIIGGAKIGTALGLAVGSGKGLVNALKQGDTSDIVHISKAYNEYIAQKIQSIRTMVARTRDDMKFSIQQDLNSQIKVQRNMLEKNIKAIQDNLTLSKAEAAQKSNAIKETYGSLKNIAKKVDDIMHAIKVTTENNVATEAKRYTAATKAAGSNNLQKQAAVQSPMQILKKDAISHEVSNSKGYFDL